jgi:predicted  nucleic acid-binding Zn-ribbon protein
MSQDPVLQALNTLIGEQSQMRGELTGLRGDLADVRADQSSMRGELTGMHATLARMQDEQTRLRVDMVDQLEKMENKLTLIREDIAVNMGRADGAHRAADNTRDELRALNEQVQSMERRQRMLSARMDQLEK